MMKNNQRGILMVLLILLALLPAAAQAETFVFTAIPDEDETRLNQRFSKVADYLARQLGVEARYIPVKSYAAAIAAFKNNHVQMAWFGGLSGVRARLAVPGSQAIAQGEEDTAFRSYFIAGAATGLQSGAEFPQAIAGLTFTFGSKGSTSGRLMPEFYIRTALGQAPEKLFRRVGFSGDHSKTIALVQSGAYQVGAVNFKVWENELKAGKINPDKVRVIWETPPYPDYNWSIRGDVDSRFGAGFMEKVRQALLEMRDRVLLEAFPRKRFIAAANKDYAPIEKTAREIGLID